MEVKKQRKWAQIRDSSFIQVRLKVWLFTNATSAAHKTVQLSNFIFRWGQSQRKRPSPVDALLWATHKPLLVTTQRRSSGEELSFLHVWFPPSSRKSQQGGVAPTGVVGANGSRLWGIPSLWTLPRIWRYGGRHEWLLLTRHPAHISEQAVHFEEVSTQCFFATRCWFRVSTSIFLKETHSQNSQVNIRNFQIKMSFV